MACGTFTVSDVSGGETHHGLHVATDGVCQVFKRSRGKINSRKPQRMHNILDFNIRLYFNRHDQCGIINDATEELLTISLKVSLKGL